MNAKTIKNYPWAVIGAGPAGIACVGLLIEQGVSSNDILWIDPDFMVGDFGKYWGEVYSNTSVKLFLRFLNEISGFDFYKRPAPFALETMSPDDCCQLKEVTTALIWVTNHLRSKVNAVQGYVDNLSVQAGCWDINIDEIFYRAHKVILATGADPKSLNFNNITEVPLYNALDPTQLNNAVDVDDCVAVFGSSHSSMIIMKNLLDCGVNKIINFYLTPLRFAVKMDGWTLYDNTGLKAHTAEWVRKNISQNLDCRIRRYISNDENIREYLKECNKAIYPVGFISRSPKITGIDPRQYDSTLAIIAPGLFGAGIGYPILKVDSLGGKEFNVGLYKFMLDIRNVLPIWLRYGL